VKTQDEFTAARQAEWEELENLLAQKGNLRRLPPRSISRAVALYRAVCADLMRARAAGYSPDVLAKLDSLAARVHNALYSAPPYRLMAVWELVRAEFPRALRRHGRVFALAVALFLLPGVVGFIGAYNSRAFALGVVPASTAEEMEKAYAQGFKGRSGGEDMTMAGFYVWNNIGIAFRCFATGVLFGIGSAFFLVYNGLQIGTVAGLVTAAGHGRNLLAFTSGHGAFELTAIVIAGAAGMVMGYALVDTRGRTRFGSLRTKAKDVAVLAMGAALMLLVAAMLEGFWSPSSLPERVKLVAAALFYVLVALYLGLAGRGGAGAGVAAAAPEARRAPP
jgi:uncharacterized membrane protein SpoIIM required for sporulation